MIRQSSKETVHNIFTALPENIAAPDIMLWVGTGVLVTWMFMLILSGPKKRWVLRVLLLSISAGLGLLGWAVYQNTNENLGGYFMKCKATDEMLFPEVDTDPDSPGRDYLIYFPGAILGKRDKSDIVKTDTAAVIPHGYNEAVRRFVAGLRPQDRLHLVGFSRGGGEAMRAAQDIRRPIASLVLADPTADLLQAVECRLRTWTKPGNVEYFKVFTVYNYNADTDSNESIRNYLFFMVARFIDRRYVEWLDTNDHGMHITGYRIDERSREALEELRRRVVEDHQKAVTSGGFAAKSVPRR